MKKLKIFLTITAALVLIFFAARIIRNFTVEDKPSEIATEHFIISYRGIYSDEAQAVADNLEGNYERVRTSLGDPDHAVIKVFIHATQTEFNTSTGLPNSHANGVSRGPLEFHVLWTNWFNSIFPDDTPQTAVHEFTHCVQLNILIQHAQKNFNPGENADFNAFFEEKFARDYPQWFWEAMSVYQANEVNTISVNYAIRNKPTLKYLNNSNQIYHVGYTIIEYIVQKWGKDKLPTLITSYVDLERVLNVSESDFEKGWIEFVDQNY